MKAKRLNVLKALVFCTLIVVVLTTFPETLCDIAPDTSYGMRINGAKVVSEGGYFWIELRNTGNVDLEVRVWEHPRFFWLDYIEYFELPVGRAVRFHLVAPEISGAYKEFGITFNYAKVFATDSPRATTVFYVVVVDLAYINFTLSNASYWEQLQSIWAKFDARARTLEREKSELTQESLEKDNQIADLQTKLLNKTIEKENLEFELAERKGREAYSKLLAVLTIIVGVVCVCLGVLHINQQRRKRG